MSRALGRIRPLVAFLLLVAPGAPLAAQVGAVTPYAPSWADTEPQRIITLEFDPALDEKSNGERLRDQVDLLVPGDCLIVGAGVWRVEKIFTIDLQGSAQRPIYVLAAPGTRPVITRTFNDQNVVNIGHPDGTITRFVVFSGFEITGGSMGVRLQACEDVWLNDLEIHDTAQAGLVANSKDTTRLTITRNEIRGTGGTGEGMYLGDHNGDGVMTFSVVAENWVHHTGGWQGDGIEVKQGSYGNWIVDNVIHDTLYPCLIVYGTDGNPVNVVERNLLYRSLDNVLQVQGEAIVRNNVMIDGAKGFSSHDHASLTRDLVFVHNTIVNRGRGADLQDWGGRPGMVFANNAVYSRDDSAVTFGKADASGVAVTGNVRYGGVYGPAAGFTVGTGLADFEDVAWDASALGALPSHTSPLRGAGDGAWLEPEDRHRAVRVDADAGAYRYGSWGLHYGYGVPGLGSLEPRVEVSTGTPLGDPTFEVRLRDGRPAQPAVLLVGTRAKTVPVGPGFLWNDASWLFFRTVKPDGSARFGTGTALPASLDGIPLYFQWSVYDAAAAGGWALTDGLELELR